jgi:RpiR family transcriptional regulator, carbohydrate utilization regulator
MASAAVESNGSMMVERVLARVRAELPSLVPSEARVARFVLDHPDDVIHCSVTELAAISSSSPSSVMRFCQRLGFKGYGGFKIALARDAATPVRRLQADVRETDAPHVILRKVASSAADAVADAAGTIDPETFDRAIAALEAAERLLVIGVGSSAPVVQDIAYRLLTIGLRVEAPVDVHVQHVAASLLGPRDACLAISHTGSTRETVAALRSAAAAGARTVAVTSFFRSPLTEVAEITLVAGSVETAFRLEAMASRLVHLSVLDAMFVALALRDRERATAALDCYGAVLGEHRF